MFLYVFFFFFSWKIKNRNFWKDITHPIGLARKAKKARCHYKVIWKVSWPIIIHATGQIPSHCYSFSLDLNAWKKIPGWGNYIYFLKSVNLVLYLLRSNSPKNCGVLGFWWVFFLFVGFFLFFLCFFCRKVTAQGTVGFRVLAVFFCVYVFQCSVDYG